MTNRFYTVLVIPEKTSQVKRLIIPSWIIRGTSVGLAFMVLLSCMMIFNYWYVMSQIGENKQLKIENRRLRQQVQIFHNKMTTAENTMDRVKTFATRLKVILHVEEQGTILPSKLPNANLGVSDSKDPIPPSITPKEPLNKTSANVAPPAPPALAESTELRDLYDPEKAELRKDYLALEDRISQLTSEAFQTEELLQDQYEILYDKRAFLAALPTRQPAFGYFTSGFGVRTSPYGDRVKMHEGLDIANRLGTVIRSTANGEVTFADSKGGYGTTVVLNHGYGLETWYGHLKKILVKKGAQIKRGDKIALMGNSGRSTGPHVHYEVRVRGTPVDPRSYIIEDPTP